MQQKPFLLLGTATAGLGVLMAVAMARTPGPAAPSPQPPRRAVLKLSALPATGGVSVPAVLSPEHPLWRKAPQLPLRLSRTPPLYAGGHYRDDGHRPSATVRLVRLPGDAVVVRLHWTDPTEDVSHRVKRIADVGAPRIYSKHPRTVSGFADAVAVMLPRRRGRHRTYPSLMMGQKDAPVDLYYWRAGLGFQQLKAAGRGTTTRVRGAKLAGSARRVPDGWEVVLPVGKTPRGTPVAFGIWDGKRHHRDGLKYFTVWYEVW